MLRGKEFWLHLDPYTANKLLAKKPDGEREFSESMHRFEIAKGHLSDALETMRGKFLDSPRKTFEGTFILAEYAHQICRCFHSCPSRKDFLCLNLLFVYPKKGTQIWRSHDGIWSQVNLVQLGNISANADPSARNMAFTFPAMRISKRP